MIFVVSIRQFNIAKDYRINNQIRSQTVRVISDKDEQVGIISLQEALDLANQRDLDLVEVAPGAEPPVCRILDYGKFKYVQTKKEKEARKSQKTVSLREVRFKSGIDKHLSLIHI